MYIDSNTRSTCIIDVAMRRSYLSGRGLSADYTTCVIIYLQVHCMQGERTVGRHIVRKFLANVLLVIAVAWLVAGKNLLYHYYHIIIIIIMFILLGILSSGTPRTHLFGNEITYDVAQRANITSVLLM